MLGCGAAPRTPRACSIPTAGCIPATRRACRDGRLVIAGRIKDIIVTSTGEKVSPADLEQAIGGDPLFEQVMVVGERRPFIAAIAVLNRPRLEDEARALGSPARRKISWPSTRFVRWRSRG